MLSFGCKAQSESKQLPANIPKEILLGMSKSRTHLVETQLSQDEPKFFLQKEAWESLKTMKSDFDQWREENQKGHQSIFLTSAFRDYDQQKLIWEKKYSGKTKMRESVVGKTPQEIVQLIMEFSSAPGTSRHHWGTDFDINILQNDYYKKNGKGEIIYEWLSQNASKYGFCQPYTTLSSRKNMGYAEERWHWSFKPISKQYREEYAKLLESFPEIPFQNAFLGSEVLTKAKIREFVVDGISDSCK